MENQKEQDKKDNIFISWSGKYSKEIAKQLKDILENEIFNGVKLDCFVSDVDIASGTDWWLKIQDEISICKAGIICVTKENVLAPWVFFEAGALTARNIPITPLLFSCDINSINKTPLTKKQCVDFSDKDKFVQMILGIRKNVCPDFINQKQMKTIAEVGYQNFHDRISDYLDELNLIDNFTINDVYPNDFDKININIIFISAPMASIEEDYYKELRDYVLTLETTLKDIGFTNVICPMFDKEDRSSFDGKTKAIIDNFSDLKQVECMLVIYPKEIATSSLVEIGYGLALSKNMVIFYKEGLPYLLEESGGEIAHVKTYKYDSYEEITKTIKSNGMTIFDRRNDR